jgi:hypothetical protein
MLHGLSTFYSVERLAAESSGTLPGCLARDIRLLVKVEFQQDIQLDWGGMGYGARGQKKIEKIHLHFPGSVVDTHEKRAEIHSVSVRI